MNIKNFVFLIQMCQEFCTSRFVSQERKEKLFFPFFFSLKKQKLLPPSQKSEAHL